MYVLYCTAFITNTIDGYISTHEEFWEAEEAMEELIRINPELTIEDFSIVRVYP